MSHGRYSKGTKSRKPFGDDAPRRGPGRGAAAVALVALLAWAPGQVLGQYLEITEDTTLTEDLLYCDRIIIAADNIVLDGDGHTISGDGCGGTGVFVLGKTGVTVKNLTVSGFGTGIKFGYTDDSTIEGVTFNSCDTAIELEWSIGLSVSNNTIYGVCRGISATSGVDEALVTGNTVNGCGAIGIGFQSSNNSVIIDNLVSGNGVGVKIGYTQGLSSPCEERDSPVFGGNGNTLSGNTVSGNGVGIKIANADHNQVLQNTVSDSTAEGILLLRSINNRVTANTVSGNAVGVKLEEADTNFVKFNTLQGNMECIVEIDAVGNHLIRNDCSP